MRRMVQCVRTHELAIIKVSYAVHSISYHTYSSGVGLHLCTVSAAIEWVNHRRDE